MNHLVIGTHNQGKAKEIKEYLFHLLLEEKFNISSLIDLKVNYVVEENGDSFFQNALLKSKQYSELLQLPVLSDDGGLVIPYLNNEPGVKSKRWAGYEMSDEELIEYTLKKMHKAEGKERKAYLTTTLVFYDSHRDLILFSEAKTEGEIAKQPSQKMIKGYPFRSLFIVSKFKKYYVDLDIDEHKQINHRYFALKKIVRQILKHY
ncbi:MAG: non-canonical purine NTP pyrophosphatase [Candidatus Parcubacteria bacterium]|nr:MAG: non-canonical purine NTP pyrophosphatase [Candidatus Parcubacteria bacterium]